MANKTFQTRVQSKIDTSENWAKATNFVPLKGEICIYSDLHRMKVGDGTTKINDLDFENPVDTALSTTSTNPVQNKAVKAGLDTKISKFGDTFTGTLTFSGDYNNAAIDLGQNGYIDSAYAIYFSHDANGIDRGFYIQAAPPATDDYYASAQFLGTDGDELVRLHGIAPPKDDGDAANKQYVDTMVKTPIDMTSDYLSSGASNIQTWAAAAKTNDNTKYKIDSGTYSISSQAEYYFVRILDGYGEDYVSQRFVQIDCWNFHYNTYNISTYGVILPGGTPEEMLNMGYRVTDHEENSAILVNGKTITLPKYNTGTDSADNNKFLRIVNGVPAWVALTNVAEEGA